jgi:hypothetical protein
MVGEAEFVSYQDSVLSLNNAEATHTVAIDNTLTEVNFETRANRGPTLIDLLHISR